MITSMTGFATATLEAETATASVTVKSVNHRFLDVALRAPSSLAAAEAGLRALIQQRIARGRVEVTLTVQTRRPTTAHVELDEAFAQRIAAAIERARELGVVSGPMQPGDLLRLPQALAIREAPAAAPEEEAAEVRRVAEAALTSALEALDTMRKREGLLLRADLDARRATLAAAIERVADAASQGQDGLKARLHERLGDLAAGVALDAQVVAQEVVRFVARSDIHEELVRFRAHLVHWEDLADGAEPCGRKLDFLLQEMNREINTIGSKSEGLQVSPIIVDVKAELERMREQVQNVE
jgi:uncharacterized protein (TIGR00255 family)